MVATYVGANTDVVVSFPTTSTTVSSFPSGHAAGNLMLLHVRVSRSSGATPTFTVSQGFTRTTRVVSVGSSAAVTSEIWFKIAEGTAGSEPQPVVQVSDSGATGVAFAASLYEFSNTTETYISNPAAYSTNTAPGLFTPTASTIPKDGLAFVIFTSQTNNAFVSTFQGFTSARTYPVTAAGDVLYKSVTAGTVTWPTYNRFTTINPTTAITFVFGVLNAGWSVGMIRY